ncbi:MAG TPA: response regulator transcription factor [Burkholderiales bacterium]|nr:response regulator transcription factor [Burkholderiales bacterium]
MTSVALLHRESELGHRLAETVAAAPGLTVLGSAGTMPALREVLAQEVPDLLLVDLMLPGAQVQSVLQELRHEVPDGRPRLLVLAVSADDPRVMAALRHGADSYFAHAHSLLSLPEAIEQLVRGESMITPQIARQLKSHFEAGGGAALPEADCRLLQWMAEGFLVSEVARALRVNAHAVGVRIRSLYRRLQADVRSQQDVREDAGLQGGPLFT